MARPTSIGEATWGEEILAISMNGVIEPAGQTGFSPTRYQVFIEPLPFTSTMPRA